jgi:nickel-dependent lactate racemase
MMHQLRYGTSSTLELELAADALVADCTQVPGEPVRDVAAVASAALNHPLEFPPLRQAVVPGDRVVIAVDPDVPCAEQIVGGVVSALLAADVAADHIAVLVSHDMDHQSTITAHLPPAAAPVQVVVHDPEDRQQLAYLAASKDAAPIVLNRLLCDADVVLPVNLLRPEASVFYAGPHGGLCPAFADAHTQQRFRTPNSMVARKQQLRRREEAREIAWLLGVQLSLQIVAGPGDSLMHLVAGVDDVASRRGQELVERVWGQPVPQKAELVIAALEGAQDNRSWDDFARALHTAQQVCTADGTIVICSELACEPGPALQRLAGFDDKDRLLQRLGNDRSADAISAWLLVEARDQSHVCLLSKLDEAAVESLGMGYIDAPGRINHMSRRCRSCILLGNAPRTLPQLGG